MDFTLPEHDSHITIDRLQAYALSSTVQGGPVSSLGNMPTRNGLLLQATADDGCIGWGEVWCNFPPRGNLAKLNLIEDFIAPALIGLRVEDWRDLRPVLQKQLHRMVVHTGEFGPFNHCFAGLDMAFADIAAKRLGLSLRHMLNPAALDAVLVYASTPGMDKPDEAVGALLDGGHNAAKLKIGFSAQHDEAVLRTFRKLAPASMALMVDANQNWTTETALETIQRISDLDVSFIEEPLLASFPIEEWESLANQSPVPLAAGENIQSLERFKQHIDGESLDVVQPDVAKWGGISGAHDVGVYALEHGSKCFMHFMGTGLGLSASVQVLAAIGGPGRVELDVNPNPLRADLGAIDLAVTNGSVHVPEGTGIGFEPDMQALERFQVGQVEIRQ